MGFYRKKPVVIEAVRVNAADWNGSSWDGCPFDQGVPGWLASALEHGMIEPDCPGSTDYAVWAIKTLEGTMIAEPGDWIIRGIKGELYPCKPDIFEATYEQVEGVLTDG